MKRRQKLLAALASCAIGMAGLTVAVPANAAPATVANCQAALNGQMLTFPTGSSNISIAFTSCAATTPASGSGEAQTNPNFILSTTTNPLQPGGGNNPSSYNLSGTLSLNVNTTGANAAISGSRQGGSGAIPDGTYTVYFGYFTSAPSTYYGSFIIDIGGSGGGDEPPSEVAAPAPTFTLTITPPVGVTCRTSGESATAGSWVSLPAANDCTSPVATPNAQLLGWATDPDFPIAIAQRQITNGWGAYEIFDASGRITAVFIPAGGAVFVSAPGSLFPIWRS